jgi:SAM-dependent methyltransferase
VLVADKNGSQKISHRVGEHLLMSDRRKIAQAYDQASDQYDRWEWQEFWHRNERPLVSEMLDRDGMVDIALDVGMGTGGYFNLLHVYSRKVIGVDISIGMMRVSMRNHPSVQHVCASAFGLPFGHSSIDRILAARVLSHSECIDKFFSQVSRVLRSGGTVIITDVDPEHNYRTINLPGKSDDGRRVQLVPRNHSVQQLSDAASSHGLHLMQHRRVGFTELSWKPGRDHLLSLDRSGIGKVFYVAQYRKYGDGPKTKVE